MFDGQKFPFSISPTDSQGKASQIEANSLAATFADEDTTNALGLTVELGPDGASGFVHAPAGISGKTVCTWSGDSDLGAGVETITFSLEIEVEHRKATDLNVTIGDPVDE